MSLIKIPFILLTFWGFVNSAAPRRNTQEPEGERFASRLTMIDNPTSVVWLVFFAKVIPLSTGTLEITTILASATPSLPISKVVLSLLVWSDGNPDKFHISNAAKVGFIALILGTWMRLAAFRHLGRFFQSSPSIQKDHELIVSGPYSVVRHPGYAGRLLTHCAWFPLNMSRGSWIVESGLLDTTLGRTLVVLYISIFIFATTITMILRIPVEDAVLRNRFGKEWDDWAKRVPYAIFPGIY